MGRLKGTVPWNKGIKTGHAPWNKGLKKPHQISGANGPAWKGGKYKFLRYVLVYSPNHPRILNQKRPYVFEHILVAEKMIGRFLQQNEIVHHLNEIRDDNRPENLQVMTRREHFFHHNPTQFRTRESMLKNRKCSLRNCGKKHWAKDFCRKHYKRFKKNGTPHIQTEVVK